jgi:stage V sporulation protein B
MKRERRAKVDSYSYIFKILFITIIPVLMSTTIYNCNAILDQAIFKNIANLQGYSANDISEWNGIYTGKYKTLINVPISIASALAASSVPALTAAYTNGKKEAVRSQINTAIRFIMVVAFPCAVGMGVLASPILQLLFRDSSELAAGMLQLGAVSIVFFLTWFKVIENLFYITISKSNNQIITANNSQEIMMNNSQEIHIIPHPNKVQSPLLNCFEVPPGDVPPG